MSHTIKHFIYILLLAIIWQSIYIIINNPLQWPSMVDTIKTMFDLFIGNNAKFLPALSSSLYVLLQCTVLSFVTISFLVILTQINHHIKGFINYCCSILGPVPAFAWLPIFLVLFGFSRSTLYALCVFSVAWWSIQNLMGQIETQKKIWQEQIENLKFGVIRSIFLVYIPSLMPSIISTAKSTWNHAWRVIFAIETTFGMLGGGLSMGTLMSEYRGEFKTTELYSMVLIVMIIGLLINYILDNLKRKYEY